MSILSFDPLGDHRLTVGAPAFGDARTQSSARKELARKARVAAAFKKAGKNYDDGRKAEVSKLTSNIIKNVVDQNASDELQGDSPASTSPPASPHASPPASPRRRRLSIGNVAKGLGVAAAAAVGGPVAAGAAAAVLYSQQSSPNQPNDVLTPSPPPASGGVAGGGDVVYPIIPSQPAAPVAGQAVEPQDPTAKPEGGEPEPEPEPEPPQSAESVVAANPQASCTETAGKTQAEVTLGKEKVMTMVQAMEQRVKAHEVIGDRIKMMKDELVHLKNLQQSLQNGGGEQAAAAAAAAAECTTTFNGIANDFGILMEEIENMNSKIRQLDMTDYNITEQIDAQDIELPTQRPT